MAGVVMKDVVKRYGGVQVIHGIDLEIENGEFCVFVGPSGCGKSTLLRMIAGLEETTEGSMSIGDRDVTRMDPAERGVAMVFQTYALYPHMTVRDNMGFGLKMNGHPKAEIAQKVAEATRILKLEEYLDRKPAALSGGQRQRVSIGRAIVRGPEVFCSTNRYPTSTPSCVSKCASRSPACIRKSGRRWSMSPTIR